MRDHVHRFLELLRELLVLLVAPGVAQAYQLSVQRRDAIAQVSVELLEMVGETTELDRVDNRLGHDVLFCTGAMGGPCYFHANPPNEQGQTWPNVLISPMHGAVLVGSQTMSQQQLRYPIFLSILAALVTLGIKFTAYWLTDSVGLLSDALESVVNLVAALTALGCLYYAAKPVDPSHTYGHEKIEYFSSGLEGVLILVAAGGIAWYAVDRLISPQPLGPLGLGTAVALVASLVNLAVARLLLRVARQTGSIVLEADGHHLMTDVWTSLAVVAGLGLVWATGLEILDPLVALGVAANIVWTACRLIVRSFNGLMDHALPAEEQAAVRAAIHLLLPTGLHFHALRTRQAGTRRFVEFHLLVPGRWTVQKAHDLTEEVEEAVRRALPRTEVTVHIEPVEADASWHDSELLPLEADLEKPVSPGPPAN
jgi:cation diffusion facilitator family transporter